MLLCPHYPREQKTNVRELVEHCWGQIKEAGRVTKEITFEIKVSHDFPEKFKLDSERICQVVSNLLENALFACGDPGTIKVDLCEQKFGSKSGIRIAVNDNGTGVDAAHRDEIFVPFFTTKTKGTGLGLAISARFVESHKGRMLVEDSDLGGACFAVELPEIE